MAKKTDKNYGSVASPSSGGADELDSWLRSDGSIVLPNLRSSAIFGPTTRVAHPHHGPDAGKPTEYKSTDRTLVDSLIWHKRKASLMAKRAKALLGSRGSEGMNYEFDADAVSSLQFERATYDNIMCAGIGVCMAFISLAVSMAGEIILDGKLEMAEERFEEKGFMSGMAFHVGASAFLAFCAFLPVAFKPISAGSGIAEAKAILNGVILPQCSTMLTAFCKGMSTILTVTAGLPAGLEGPMIHLGLCVGANLPSLIPARGALDPLRTRRTRIEYTAVGTAAGVAAAFRAPISGVLFAMEEGASFWSTELTWMCFKAACVSVITLYGLLSALEGGNFSLTSMGLFNGISSNAGNESNMIPATFVPEFKFWEYGLFVIVGLAGGCIGASFCMINRVIALKRRELAMSTLLKAVEVLTVTTLYTSMIWILPSLPFFSRCGNVADRDMPAGNFRQFDCPEGQYNELATLLLNLGGKGITLMFQESAADAFSFTTCVTTGLVYLFSLCVVFGCSFSGGIFIPSICIGAFLGRAFGIATGLDPRTYAIVGATSTLGGVVRVLISITSILTTTTSLTFFMTPIMVAALFSQISGNWLSGQPGVYDVILQLRRVPFLEESCPEGARHANIRARNIMKTGLITLGTKIQVGDLVEALKNYQISDFPVVDRDLEGGGGGTLVGMISRDDLRALLLHPSIFFSCEESDCDESYKTRKTLSYAELYESKRILPAHNHEGQVDRLVSPADMKKILHLSPYIQIAPHTFDGHGSAERAYEMFRSLGLRALFVVDKSHQPIGVITRLELHLLEEIGHEVEHEKQVRRATIYATKGALKDQFE